jgi:hypothetical protein
MKSKVITTTPEALESAINAWLTEAKPEKILAITQTETIGAFGASNIVATILFT